MMAALRSLYARHRRRIALLVLVIGLFVVGRELHKLIPRTTDLVFDLGPRHSEVVELRLSYATGGEAVRSVRYAHPKGAPASIRDQIRASASTLELEAVLLLRGGGSRFHARRITASPDAPLRLSLPP